MENGVTKVETIIPTECNTDTQKKIEEKLKVRLQEKIEEELKVRLQEKMEEELEARLEQERDIWRDKLETLQAQCEGGLSNITTT